MLLKKNFGRQFQIPARPMLASALAAGALGKQLLCVCVCVRVCVCVCVCVWPHTAIRKSKHTTQSEILRQALRSSDYWRHTHIHKMYVSSVTHICCHVHLSHSGGQVFVKSPCVKPILSLSPGPLSLSLTHTHTHTQKHTQACTSTVTKIEVKRFRFVLFLKFYILFFFSQSWKKFLFDTRLEVCKQRQFADISTLFELIICNVR